ncbi:MAG: hypothetical protein ABIY62_07865 [Ginsengibacter sp.]
MSEKNASKKNARIPDIDPINDAYKEAEKDIEKDPDLSAAPQPGDDLDEGELARLEGHD